MRIPNFSEISHLMKKKQWRNFIVVAAIVIFLFIIFVSSNGTSQKEPKSNLKTPTTELTVPSLPNDDQSYWRQEAENRLSKTELRTQQVEEKIVNLLQAQQKQDTGSLEKQVRDLQEKIVLLEQQQASSNESQKNQQAFPIVDNRVEQHVLDGEENKNIVQKPEEHIVNLVAANQIEKPTAENYVPAGSFVKAVLLSGLDASAGVTTQGNPRPVLLRLVDPGNLPNATKSHLRDCFITAAGIGDISSERAYLRLETLSCKRTDGTILDIPVYGTVVGTDGKDGIRGKPVWREGALLQRAAAAGALSGFGNAINQTYTTNSISPLGTTQTVDPNAIWKTGAASGASNAMNKLADYNIKRAEQYQPVIQISAGTKVDVLFLKGFYLENQHENAEEKRGQG